MDFQTVYAKLLEIDLIACSEEDLDALLVALNTTVTSYEFFGDGLCSSEKAQVALLRVYRELVTLRLLMVNNCPPVCRSPASGEM